MPRKPRKACSVFGCPELTDGGKCEKHRKQSHREYKKTRTDKTEQAFYTKTVWRNLRRLKLAQDPLCQRCLHPNSATVVHHREEIKQGGAWLPELEELESLCSSCHSKEHGFGS